MQPQLISTNFLEPILTNPTQLFIAITAGLALGVFYFVGLLFTVERLARSENPALLVISSLFIRLAVTLTVFFLVMQHHWQNLLACLLGFLFARFIIVRTQRNARHAEVDIIPISSKQK